MDGMAKLRGHNSAVEWAREGLPGGLVQDEDFSEVETEVEIEVRSEV
jgi:hypothetical protein